MANHNDRQAGWVYVLTNPSFREDWVKIGKSSRPVDVRSKELDNTAVPLPFEIYATLKTTKYEVVEKKIHKAIDRLTDFRIRQNREFFNIKPVKEGLSAVDDEAHKPRRSRFRFSMIGVPIGATVVFEPTKTEVKVADDDKVEFEGRIYKLSPFAGTFMPDNLRNESGAYQGSKYFSFKGRLLDDLRRDAEAETGVGVQQEGTAS